MLASLPGSSNLAFAVVFGIFVVAFVSLLIYVAVWAIRRDAAGRRQWQAEYAEDDGADAGPVGP